MRLRWLSAPSSVSERAGLLTFPRPLVPAFLDVFCAPAADSGRRRRRNSVRPGRVSPDVVTTAWGRLLEENAFYFAQNGRGIPFRRDRNLRSDRSRNLRSPALGPAKASGMPKAQMTAPASFH